MEFKDYWNKEHHKWINNPIKMDDWLDKHQELIKNTNSKILDLGCGLGNDSLYLAKLNKEVIAIDYSKEALDFVSKNIKGIETLELDISKKLPFKDNEFELIIADLSLHYFDNKTTFEIMYEIKRILKDNGVLLARVNSINDFNYGINDGKAIEWHYYFVNGYNKRFFSKEDIGKYFMVIGDIYYKEYIMNRYSKPKNVFEVKVIKKSFNPKFKEFIKVKTLVDKGNIKKGTIGIIIDIYDYPCEGYEVEFGEKIDCSDIDFQSYSKDELEEIKE